MAFFTRKPFSVIKTTSSFVQSKARWFKTRHPTQPRLLSHRQPRMRHVNGVSVLSICTVFWRRDLFPTPSVATMSMWLTWKRQQSLFRLHAPLKFVCLDTVTCCIFPLLVSLFPSFYFIFLSPPSKEIFPVVF